MNDFGSIDWTKVEGLGSKTSIQKDMFIVSWLLGRYCNYRCSYCWPYARSDKKDFRPKQVIISTIDEIKRQAREKGFNSFNWSLSGGEPTFHPNFLDIVQHLANDSCFQRFHMTSNCSRPLQWFNMFTNITKKFDRVSVTASVHFEALDSKDKIEDFISKLRFIQSKCVRVTINMVMVPDQFWDLYEWAQYFRENGLHTTLKPQSDPTASFVVDGYTDEMLNILHEDMKTDTNEIHLHMSDGNHRELDQAERLNAFQFNKFKGWDCSSGYRSIIIREPDGYIKRSYSCSDRPLGHIETGFKLFDEVMPCITESCVSSADSKIPKRKPGCQMPLWKS